MAGYGDNDGFNAWLAANGHVLPQGAPSPAVLRERGSSYIDAVYGPRFTGYPTGGEAQERAWPRTGATAYGSALASSLVPARVVNASYAAAWIEATNPGMLSAVVTGSSLVKREKVEGAVEVEYAVSDKTDVLTASQPVSAFIEGLLAPLLGPAFAEPAILVV